VLDPEMDPIALMEEDALEVMLIEAERRLEPDQLLAWASTQAGPLARMPRRLGQLASRLESGTLKVGFAPTDLEGLEGVVRSAANRIGSSIIVAALLVSSALIARVHDLRWVAAVGFALSFLLGLYMVWKIIRTPGSL
jgi:ubiquinone biosynthesis protein